MAGTLKVESNVIITVREVITLCPRGGLFPKWNQFLWETVVTKTLYVEKKTNTIISVKPV